MTQEISRYIYEQTAPSGRRAFDGISYLSKLGDDFRNWALFEPVGPEQTNSFISDVQVSAIGSDHPELRLALRLLGIRFIA